MYRGSRFTKFWYIRKAAVRYESRENISYGPPKLVSSIAETLISYGYPVRDSLIVEIAATEKFFGKRGNYYPWFVTRLYSMKMISAIGVELDEDSILAPSKFFIEKGISEPVAEIMLRIPPKCDWKIIENTLLVNPSENRVHPQSSILN